MEVAGTTSIAQLPISSQIDTNNSVVQAQNVKINNPIQEQIVQRNQQLNSTPQEEQKVYNQLVSDIQQASVSGQTILPSRDIPQSTNPLVQDKQIQPNYIPEDNQEDYIQNDTTVNQIIAENKKEEDTNNYYENIYQELQYPILVGVMFFLFQLPSFQKYLYNFIPLLFKSDGNLNVYGYLFNSFLFGFLYYVIEKILKNFLNN